MSGFTPVNGFFGNGGGISLSGIYDGTKNFAADILALDPTTHLGETWWAFDEKAAYKAVSVIDGSDQWQQVALKYDELTDSFIISATQDGQTQDIGQETFFLAVNTNGSGATELDPKVFLSIKTTAGDEFFQDVLLATAGDLAEGFVFGINTTILLPGDKGKVTTYGKIKSVNTSAWNLNDILYVDPDTPGNLTNVQPEINAFNVAKVLKVGATDGVIFVNTITSNRIDSATIPVGIDLVFLTGDEETTTEGTFYLAKLKDEGTVASATVNVVVPDNSTVGASQDHLSSVFPAPQTFNSGLRVGQIEFQVDSGGGEEKLYFEMYDTDDQGAPIDSGIVANPVGDLGVRPVVTLSTSLLNSAAGVTQKQEVRGLLENDFVFEANHRVRVHVLCEKIGVVGGDKTFTLFYGSDHDSFLEALATIDIEDVAGLPEALDLRAKWVFPWVQATYDDRTMTRVNEYLMISNKETDDYPAPRPIGSADFLMDLAVFGTQTDTSIIYSGHKYIFNTGGWVSDLRVYPASIGSTITYRVVIIDNTDPANPIFETIDNPILTPNQWNVLSSNSIIVVPGTELIIYLAALNSGSDSQVTGGWTNGGSSNVNPPANQSWNYSNNNAIVRIDKTDLDSVDRSVELAGIVAGSELQFVETLTPANFLTFETIGAPVDQGSYFEYATFLTGSGGTLVVSVATTLTATIPVPSPTEYKEDLLFWQANDPAFADVQGFLQFDGVDQGGNADTGFGVDVKFQQAEISPDWDLMAISGSGSSSGGGGGATETVIFSDDFEDATLDAWTTVNDTTNVWINGSASAISGTRSAYISNNASTASYDTNTANVSHLYAEINIPASIDGLKIAFAYRVQGEEGLGADEYDYARVFLTDDTFTPVAGTVPTVGASVRQLGRAKYVSQDDVIYEILYLNPTDLISVVNSTQRLIFTWKNDNVAGNQPPMIIDDVVVSHGNFYDKILSGVVVGSSISQSINHLSFVKLQFTTNAQDRGHDFDMANNRFTAPREGWYSVNGGGKYQVSTPTTMEMHVVVNSNRVSQNSCSQSNSGGTPISVSWRGYLRVGDIVEIETVQVQFSGTNSESLSEQVCSIIYEGR
jgi:hypothetical protein